MLFIFSEKGRNLIFQVCGGDLYAFFLNNEIPHKVQALPLKYAFLKTPDFLSVENSDWKMSPAQILERERQKDVKWFCRRKLWIKGQRGHELLDPC